MVIKKVRLGAGAPAIGIPFFWPSAAMPNAVMPEWSDMVFLKWNGAKFSASTYPKLALVIPSLTLTESRGEFPRIWDDGRGVDTNRALLSSQSSQNLEHSHEEEYAYGGYASTTTGPSSMYAKTYYQQDSKTFARPPAGWIGGVGSGLSSRASGGTESRPRNVAFNFLVRAK